MMEYKRLTKWISGVPAIKTYTGSYMTPFDSDVYDAIKRLAYLEDKIEQGKMIELPCIIVGNGAIDAFGKVKAPYYQVLWLDEFGMLKIWKSTDKEEAEKRLKELQNG